MSKETELIMTKLPHTHIPGLDCRIGESEQTFREESYRFLINSSKEKAEAVTLLILSVRQENSNLKTRERKQFANVLQMSQRLSEQNPVT